MSDKMITNMIKKEALIKALDEFPEEFSIDELIDKMLFIQKVQNGIIQSKLDQVISQEEARDRMAKWLR